MRSPGRKRARPQELARDIALAELRDLSGNVTYVGSPEHKSYPSFAGQPRLRSDATPCPKEINDAGIVTEWLRRGILDGQVSAYRDQGRFPRYVWSRIQDRWFGARLVNAESGSYKGYPITDGEVPRELRRPDR